MDNLSLSAEERVLPKIPSATSKKYPKTNSLYIGVTPEFFSKMKSRLLKSVVLHAEYWVQSAHWKEYSLFFISTSWQS
jgi:hypothetical protein